MYKYRKAIIVLFFCLLGDIAYSAEKYSKKSQKSFNTFLELSQSSEYTKLLKKNVSSFIGLQKELAVFYQADAYFRLKNYKKSYETYKQLPASLGQVFVNKIIFYFIQAKQTNPHSKNTSQDFISTATYFPRSLKNAAFIKLALETLKKDSPDRKKFQKHFWLLGEIKSLKNINFTNKEYLIHLNNLYKKKEYTYLTKEFPKIQQRFKSQKSKIDKKNNANFLYLYARTLRKKKQYTKALQVLNDTAILKHSAAIALKFNLYLATKQKTKAHNYINFLKGKVDQRIINQLRLDFGNYHYLNREYQDSLYRFSKVQSNHIKKQANERMLWYQFFAGLHKNDFTAKKYLTQSKKQKFYSSKYAASICFWEIKAGYKKIANEKNPCFPQYFLSYYTWQVFRLKEINPQRTSLLQDFSAKKSAQQKDFSKDYLFQVLLKLYELEDEKIADRIVFYFFKTDKSKENFLRLAALFQMQEKYNNLIKLANISFSFKKLKNDAFLYQWLQTLYPLGYYDEILKLSKKNNLDPYLVLALIREESHFNPEIASSAGALGLMQLMPFTAKEVARRKKVRFQKEKITDIATNLDFGITFLRWTLDMFDGNRIFALAAYNGGAGNVNKWRKREHEDLDYFVEYIPFSETRNYVKKVLRSYEIYKYLYAE